MSRLNPARRRARLFAALLGVVITSPARAAGPSAVHAPASMGLPASTRVFLLPSSPTPTLASPAPASEEARLRVAVAGEGPAVVLIPSLLASSYAYRRLVPQLTEAGYRAIAIEPLGVGGSARPEKADYSLTAQADRIAAALAALGADRVVLVAHSAAAAIAFRMAYRHPEKVAGIVSLEGGVPESATTPGFRRALAFAPLIRLLGGRRIIRGKVRSALLGGAADKSWVTEDVVSGYIGGGLDDLGAALRAYKMMANAREPEPLAPRLAEVRCPVRLLLGAVPHQAGPSAAEVDRMQEALPSLVVERVPAAGHFVYEEAPAAVVAAVGTVLR